jgi:hypothetical protein
MWNNNDLSAIRTSGHTSRQLHRSEPGAMDVIADVDGRRVGALSSGLKDGGDGGAL